METIFILYHCVALQNLPNGIELKFQPIRVLPFVNISNMLYFCHFVNILYLLDPNFSMITTADQKYLQGMNLQTLAEKSLLIFTQETGDLF